MEQSKGSEEKGCVPQLKRKSRVLGPLPRDCGRSVHDGKGLGFWGLGYGIRVKSWRFVFVVGQVVAFCFYFLGGFETHLPGQAREHAYPCNGAGEQVQVSGSFYTISRSTPDSGFCETPHK